MRRAWVCPSCSSAPCLARGSRRQGLRPSNQPPLLAVRLHHHLPPVQCQLMFPSLSPGLVAFEPLCWILLLQISCVLRSGVFAPTTVRVPFLLVLLSLSRLQESLLDSSTAHLVRAKNERARARARLSCHACKNWHMKVFPQCVYICVYTCSMCTCACTCVYMHIHVFYVYICKHTSLMCAPQAHIPLCDVAQFDHLFACLSLGPGCCVNFMIFSP